MTRHILALLLLVTAANGAPQFIGPESSFTHDLKRLTNAPTWRAGIGVPGWEDFDGLTLSTNGGVALADPITRDVTITNASFAVYGLPGGTNFADNFYIGGAFSVTNALLNIRSFGALGGTNNDTVAIQAALDAATDGTVVWYPPNPDGYTHDTVILKHPNVTIDGGNNEIACPTDGTELIRVLPASLYASGRLAGTDYPPNWMNGATPAPVDGDLSTMMHEHDPSLRVTNIVVKNFRSSRDGNLLRAYSVDGLKLEHLTINSANNSALRVFHSSDISMTRCDLRGGAGSYTVMFIKCRKANITGNYFHSTGYRSLSFKGAIHKSGTSIFNSLLTTDYEDAQIDIYDNVFDYDWDCAFIDWPPDSGDDVGDVNGLTIGFSKAEWYGRFRGIKFHDNMCSFVGTYSNGKGRTFWASYPHEKITIENNTILNGGFFLAGVDGGSITGNNLTWTKQSANAIFIQDETGTTPATVTRNISIKGNRLYNYHAAGTGGGTDPEIFYADGLSIDIEENYFYGIATTGVPNLIVIGPSLDESSIQRNRAYLDSGVAILANIVLSTFGAVNNLHGTTSDNTVFDTATGVTKTAGMMIFDNGAGSGFQIIAKGGYAGIGLMASNKVDYLGQFYEDLANTNLVIYHNTAPRITVKADGSSEFSSYLTLEETTDPTGPLTNKAHLYLKDNGGSLTRVYYRTTTETNRLANADGDTLSPTSITLNAVTKTAWPSTTFGLAYSFGATPYTVTDSYADLNTGSVVQTDVLTTGTYLVTATILIHCPADFTAQTAFVKLVNTESAADLTGSETWSYFGALTALHSQQVTTSALTTITTSGRVKVQVKNGNPATGELAVSETPGCRVTWIKVL
jgi:hypothetical protein